MEIDREELLDALLVLPPAVRRELNILKLRFQAEPDNLY
jgi:hypothetical protein